MAHLESRNGWYRLVFHLKGERFAKSLNTKSDRAAASCLAQVSDNLYRFDQGQIDIPEGCDPFAILLNRTGKSHTRDSVKAEIKSVSIKRAWQVFKQKLPVDSLEESTLSGMQTYVDHLARLLGTVTLNQIDKPMLQKYIDDRSKESGRYDRNVSVQTIKKELRTFSTIWNWMIEEKLVSHPFPSKKLRYPKFQEKPPFRTWKQIEFRIQHGGLSKYQIKTLWDCLFLNVSQVEAALAYAMTNARQPIIYRKRTRILFITHNF